MILLPGLYPSVPGRRSHPADFSRSRHGAQQRILNLFFILRRIGRSEYDARHIARTLRERGAMELDRVDAGREFDPEHVAARRTRDAGIRL